jgi:delta1-piperideine-2-carboxylate reductase
MGFAAPREGSDPVVFDQASSGWSNGDVQIARREGRALPGGIGVDRNGNPTTDPSAVLDGGALLPFGGHKGSSIAMMMEIMGAALAGGDYSFEIDWSGHPGAATPHGGQTYILIDPGRGNTRAFAARIETLIDAIHDAGQSRLPGDRRYANRKIAEKHGIPLSAGTLDNLRKLAAETR